MSISSVKVKKLVRKLLKDERSWRRIASEDYDNRIHYSALCKFAISDGEYIPNDVEIQRLLGIYRNPRRLTPKTIYNSEMGQSWTLYMRHLIKSLRTPTPKELINRKWKD